MAWLWTDERAYAYPKHKQAVPERVLQPQVLGYALEHYILILKSQTQANQPCMCWSQKKFM